MLKSFLIFKFENYVLFKNLNWQYVHERPISSSVYELFMYTKCVFWNCKKIFITDLYVLITSTSPNNLLITSKYVITFLMVLRLFNFCYSSYRTPNVMRTTYIEKGFCARNMPGSVKEWVSNMEALDESTIWKI